MMGDIAFGGIRREKREKRIKKGKKKKKE